MEWIENGVAATCNALGRAHINCSAELLEIRLGHVLFVVAFVALVLLVLRLTIWRTLADRGYETIQNITFSGTPVNGEKAVYIHPWDLAEVDDQEDLLKIPKTIAEQKLRPDFEKKYYRVIITEQNGEEIYRNELRVLPRSYGQERGDGRLDANTLDIVRRRNKSYGDGRDNNTNNGVNGRYRIEFREVRIWDVWHWLTHPNRDIRLALWVAIIAATIEYTPDLLDIIKSFWTSV